MKSPRSRYMHRLPSCTRCDLNPSFAFPGEGANKCSRHAHKGMVNVSAPTCREPGCGQIAGYGLPGFAAAWCRKHMKKGMCSHRERLAHPPLYVRRCKTPQARQCEHDMCYRKAQFGYRGETVGRWCKLHKKEGMLNLSVKRCEVEGCEKFPSWGFEGQQVKRCRSHAEEGMTDRKKRCTSCPKIATFGMIGGEGPQWCKTHAPAGSRNGGTPRCSVESCNKFAGRKSEGRLCREHQKIK